MSNHTQELSLPKFEDRLWQELSALQATGVTGGGRDGRGPRRRSAVAVAAAVVFLAGTAAAVALANVGGSSDVADGSPETPTAATPSDDTAEGTGEDPAAATPPDDATAAPGPGGVGDDHAGRSSETSGRGRTGGQDEAGELTVKVDGERVTAVEENGVTKYEIAQTFAYSQEGDVVQVWFDPERGGPTDLNIAFADAEGREIQTSDPMGVAITETVDGEVAAGEVIVPPVARNGGGSGFAWIDIPRGEWRLTIEAQSVDEPIRPLVGSLTFTVD